MATAHPDVDETHERGLNETDERDLIPVREEVSEIAASSRQTTPREMAAALSSLTGGLQRASYKSLEPKSVDWNWWFPDDGRYEHSPAGDPSDLRWKTLVTRIDARPKVMHILNREFFVGSANDAPDLNYSRLMRQAILHLDSIPIVLSLRHYAPLTLAHAMRARSSALSLSRRLRILSQILEGLEALHSQGQVHGDLRPENVAILDRGAVLFDYYLRTPLDLLTDEQRAYTAPEALTQKKPGAAADVFSFGKLAQRLLSMHIWSGESLYNGMKPEALEWILDYCTLAVPKERPTISEVRAALTDRPKTRTPRPLKYGQGGSHTDSVARLFALFPETMIIQGSPSRVDRIRGLIDIDGTSRSAYYDSVNTSESHPEQSHSSDSIIEPIPSFPPDLDTRWRDKVHRFHFDSGILPDHDESLPIILPFTQLWRARREYQQHLDSLTDIRSQMLRRDSYYFSADVASRMGGSSVEVSPADVAVLRRWGYLLAVQDHGRWIYPAFQFDADGWPRSEIKNVNDLFADDDKWEVLSWWQLPRTDLNGSSLAQYLPVADSRQAIDAAIRLMATGE